MVSSSAADSDFVCSADLGDRGVYKQYRLQVKSVSLEKQLCKCSYLGLRLGWWWGIEESRKHQRGHKDRNDEGKSKADAYWSRQDPEQMEISQYKQQYIRAASDQRTDKRCIESWIFVQMDGADLSLKEGNPLLTNADELIEIVFEKEKEGAHTTTAEGATGTGTAWVVANPLWAKCCKSDSVRA